jgi:hypothetical protein
MGTKDTKTKAYMSNPEHFADAFNYYIFKGQKKIQPEKLEEVDPTEIGIILKDDVSENIQKIRDVLKICTIMEDNFGTYIFLGIENQSDIHYAMPVKNMTYDALRYEKQVDQIAKQHKKNGDLKGDEFLSGFSKGDKIKPVITLTVYFGNREWDAPRCLYDMMEMDQIPNELKKFIPDYRLNLIVPTEITDFSLFSTQLGQVLRAISASKDKDSLGMIAKDKMYEHLDVETADLIKEFTTINFPIEEGAKEVNMCKAMEDLIAEGRTEGRIEVYFESVQDNVLAVHYAASKLGISEAEFEKRMTQAGYKIPSVV